MRGLGKFAALAAAVVLGTAFAVVAAPSAYAVTVYHDMSNLSITCNDTVGSIYFSTPLTLGGTTPTGVRLHYITGDCVDSNGVYDCADKTQVVSDTCLHPTGDSISRGSTRGTLTSPTNDCLSLLDGASPAFSVKVPIVTSWSTNPGTPRFHMGFNRSTVSISKWFGGEFNDGGVTSPVSDADSWGGQYALIMVGSNAAHGNTPTPSITGEFTGGDGGASSTIDVTSSQSWADLGSQCLGHYGIPRITLAIGGFTYG